MDLISYKIKTATSKMIYLHLDKCKDNFFPSLDKRVDLKEYAEKLFKNSITFEAWEGKILIGLIAAYFNDIKGEVGYITSVSVEEKYLGLGIAMELMRNCIGYAKKNQLKEIYLEVNIKSISAINLYEKFGFKSYLHDNDFLKMKLNL